MRSDLDRNPLLGAALWAAVDARVRARLGRLAQPLRAVIRGVRAGRRVPVVHVELRAGETLDNVELGRPWGLTSVPPAGTEAVAVAIAGAGHHRVVVAELDRGDDRPTDLLAGEVALYSAGGAEVRVMADGSVRITGGVGTITVTAAGLVQLNAGSGTAGVARVGDIVAAGPEMTAWIAAITTAVNALAGGSILPPVEPHYTISTGSGTVSAGD